MISWVRHFLARCQLTNSLLRNIILSLCFVNSGPSSFEIIFNLILSIISGVEWNQKKRRTNLYFSCGITPKRVTRGGIHLCDLAHGHWTTQLPSNIAAMSSRWWPGHWTTQLPSNIAAMSSRWWPGHWTTQLPSNIAAMASRWWPGHWTTQLPSNIAAMAVGDLDIGQHSSQATLQRWRAVGDLDIGQHSSQATLQRWRAVGDAVSDLTGPEIEPQTSRSDSDVFYVNWLFLIDIHRSNR